MCPPPKVTPKKRLTDFVTVGVGVQLEGRRLDGGVEDILGEEIELLDFVILPSKQYGGEFAVMQFHWKDELCTTACGGTVVIDALKQMAKQYLPVLIQIIRVKGKLGRYYSIK